MKHKKSTLTILYDNELEIKYFVLGGDKERKRLRWCYKAGSLGSI